jgi:UDP-glucose 4-epimerase
MRILLSGGAGFIGSHVADAFLAEGHDLAVVDNLSTGRRENVPRAATLVVADIRDPSVGEVFSSFRPEVLCHLAAQVDVRRSVADPAFDAQINVVASLQLLEHARRAGCRRILFSSTGGAIYGEQDVTPAPESHPARPVSPYGCAKLAVERYLHFYEVVHGFRTTCLRYANVYGPRQNPHGEAGIVAIFVDKMLSGETPTIYGDGRQTRDFVYVGDVARANVLALARGLGGTYNVGTGVETSVNDLAETLRAIVGYPEPARRAAAKPGEQRRSCLDATRLGTEGWTAAMSIRSGLAITAAWFRERLASGSPADATSARTSAGHV